MVNTRLKRLLVGWPMDKPAEGEQKIGPETAYAQEGLARMEGSKEEFSTTAATMVPFGMSTAAPAADS